MKPFAQVLSTSTARGIATMCAAFLVVSAHNAQAGINVWTSHGPPGRDVLALAIDPITPSTLYAGTNGGGVFSIQQATAKVVGTGAAASCTDAALHAALAGGGLVTFNCGGPATIDVSAGTGTKVIAADTTIDGGGLVTISGGNSVGVFSVHSGVNFTVRNLTIANGHAGVACGGGIFSAEGGALTVTNSAFTSNSGLAGGGICSEGTLTVTNSAFTSNSAGAAGGGIFNAGTATLTSCTIRGNVAGPSRDAIGGGIANSYSATLTLTDCTLSGNSAGESGGGVYADKATLTNCTLSNNSADYGGGIITGDRATLTNCTLSNNSASFGGGIYTGGTTMLTNSIVANSPSGGNCVADGAGTIVGSHNLSNDNTCLSRSELVNTDPQLAPLANYGGPTETLALCMAAGVPDPSCSGPSPAIGAGDQSVCAAPPVNNRDQRGGVRPGRGSTRCSIGAYEADAGCLGSCDANSRVTVDEIITLVNIALGNVQPLACPRGIPGGAEVDVALIIQAVNNTLNGCPSTGSQEVLSGTLFVTDSLANKVHALDAATGEILASADTGEHPVGVEKTKGKVYVANEASDTISVFDSATLAPRTVIPACARPHHTAVSSDGTRFYAACVGNNKVAVVDTETDTRVGLLTSGAPEAMTHQPWPTKDGERLWVTNFGTNDITEIDLQTGAILRMFPLDARPIEVVVPADAKTAYVSVPEQSKMKVFDLETNQLVAEPTMLAPENLMLSRDGKTILSSWSGLHNPTAASIFDTKKLTSVNVTLPRGTASHTDLTPRAKYGFVSLAGRPQGIVVVDIAAAMVHAFYPIADAGLVHAVRYAPGPP